MSAAQAANRSLAQLEAAIPRCQRCPELRAYCADVARTKRKSFAACMYWGRPVPGFGDGCAQILIVGLAPGAHGANRTGRMFTGDRSGDFLYAALHRAGLANRATSTSRDDGLELRGVYIGAALHCAPPANKPTTQQLANCAPFLAREFHALQPQVVVALGAIAWNAMIGLFETTSGDRVRPRPRFAHAAEFRCGNTVLMGCYHVSQQNTFTGRLTEPMLDAVLQRARGLAQPSR